MLKFSSVAFPIFIFISSVFVADVYAEVITVGIANNLGKNEKPVMILKTAVEPLNKEASESGLSIDQIKNTIESLLRIKSFQFAGKTEAILTIKFIGMKNKTDFSGYISLDISGEEKTTSSGMKYHQEI